MTGDLDVTSPMAYTIWLEAFDCGYNEGYIRAGKDKDMRDDLDPLQKEIEFYNNNKHKWIDENLEGLFVLVKHLNDGCEFDTYDSMGEAYTAGIELYGNVPMLIREIQEIEPIQLITRLL